MILAKSQQQQQHHQQQQNIWKKLFVYTLDINTKYNQNNKNNYRKWERYLCIKKKKRLALS